VLDLSGIFYVLIGIALVSLSSFELVAFVRLKGITTNLLAFVITAYATIVLLAQVLSELYAIHRFGFIIGHALIVLIVFPWCLKSPSVRLMGQRLVGYFTQKIAWRCALSYPAIMVLGCSVLASMVLGAYLIVVVPPNDVDSLWFHLPRMASWLQNGTLHHFQAPNLWQTVFSINAEIGLLWLTALWGTDQLTGFVQWFATVFTLVGIYGIARHLKFSKLASVFAALIWSTLTIVVVQSTSTKNDALVAFLVVASFYFLMTGLHDDERKYSPNFIFFGLSIGLAVGTKETAVVAIPGLGLAAALLTLYQPNRSLSKLVYVAFWGLAGTVLVGSYNYILNWQDYGSVLGPASVSTRHTALQGLSLAVFKANAARISYQFFSPIGLPDPLITLLQPWRSWIGERLFYLLKIDLNPPGTNLEGTTFSFSTDVSELSPRNRSWYGPLGSFLFLPTFFFYLVVHPFVKRDMEKWLTALISLSYIVIFIVIIRWQPSVGRMLMIGVALGAPLIAGFYVWTEKHKWLRWSVLAIAITVLGWSSTHNYNKPLFGSWTIWNADYYDLRTLRQSQADFFRYLDADLPEDASIGLAFTGGNSFQDYLFWGPGLTRKVSYLGPPPERVDSQIFAEHHIDYLLLAEDAFKPVSSTAPLWPIGVYYDQLWFLVKRSDMNLFAAQPDRENIFYRTFGDEYAAYVQIRGFVEKETATGRILTTDPKMPCYDLDQRFVFGLPGRIGDLAGFAYLVVTPHWSPQDYERFGLSVDDINQFLAQKKFVKKVYEVNGYTVYRILFSKADI
jgi:hypothetical protein